MKHQKSPERGVALVMVMATLAILTVLLAEVQEDASSELAAAITVRDGVQAEYFAKSATNLSRLLIASEPTVRTAMAPLFMFMRRTPPQLPVWEFSDRILGAFNDSEAAGDFAATAGLDMSLGKNLGLKGGRFEVVILDEESKINLNMGAANEIAHIRLAQQLMAAMGPPVHNPIFEQRDSTGNFHDRLTVCSSLIDWADMDEQRWSCDLATTAPTGQVIEDYSYYSMLPKPYRAKNAPYDSLEELRLVRGISDDFWLTFVNRDPKNPRKRDMTVWGQGAVNVNTASGSTLLALVCSGSGAPESELCTNPTQMATFLAGVTMARGISMGAPLFGNSGDFMTMMKGGGLLGPLLATLGLKPIKFKSESEFTRAISTESKFFSIYAVGVVKGYKRETRIATHTVVDFRTAPVVTATAPVSLGTGVPPAPPAPTATVAQSDVTSIAAALQPSTGGQIVYYRVE